MTMYDAKMIFDHWKTSPPLRILVTTIAATLGVDFGKMAGGAPKEDDKKYMTEQELQLLIARTGGKIPGMQSINGGVT